MKALKIFGKILLALLVILVVAMATVPFFYKDKVTDLVKKEINKQVHAEVDFKDVDLSLFRHFPNAGILITDVSVVNLPSDTLLTVGRIDVIMNLFHMFRDDAFEVRSVEVDQPSLSLKVDKMDTPNWNILMEEETTELKNMPEEEMVFLLKKVHLKEGKICYRNEGTNLSYEVSQLDMLVKGSFTESRTDLHVKATSAGISLMYNGIKYLNNTKISLDALIDANIKDEIYNLKNNSLYLNGLRLNFEGSVAYVNDDISLMLVYNAPDNEFSELLSLIPAIYQESFDQLTADGKFNLEGYIKGVYSDGKMPDLRFHTDVADAEISYKDMPAALTNIAFDLNVESRGNDPDKMTITLDRLTATLKEDRLSMALFMTNVFTNPFIDTKVAAGFHLENLQKVFPKTILKQMTGEVLADFTVKGSVNDARQSNYKNLLAMGSVILQDTKFDLNEESQLLINHAQFNLSPAKIDIIGFDSRIGNNSFMAEGKMLNYLDYFLSDGMFTGNLEVESAKLDVNELLQSWSSEEHQGNPEDKSTEVTFIPQNMDVLVALRVDTVNYKKFVFTHLDSRVHVHEGRLDFDMFQSDFLNGLINAGGYYTATPDVMPHIDLDLKFQDMNVSSAYENLSVFRQFVPVAEKAEGVFNSVLSLSADLDRQMNPVWTSVLGSGKFASDNIKLNTLAVFQKITDVIGVDLFQNPSTGPIDLTFKILDGKLYNSPFTVKMDHQEMEIGGWTGLDKTLDYNIAFKIPVSSLGTDVGNLIDKYASSVKKIGIDPGDLQVLKPVVNISGDFNNPEVRLISVGGTTGDGVKEVIENKVDEVIDEYQEKANEEAEKIIAEAQKKADSIVQVAQAQAAKVEQMAQQTVTELKAEARVQADQLVQEAAKQGMVAELAAKTAAQELLANADKQADNILREAQQKSTEIIEKAHKQSEQIIQLANEKADKIRD